MGATDFYTVAKGKTARDAFVSAREEAFHRYGHDGYTGSIAEKDTFKMFVLPAGEEPGPAARRLLDEAYKSGKPGTIDDKYGPAGCLDLGNGSWLFFGMAAE